MNKFEDAESILQEALNRDSNNPETLLNMSVLAQNLGKSAEVSYRFISQLKAGHDGHTFTKDYQCKVSDFQRIAGSYKTSIAAQ